MSDLCPVAISEDGRHGKCAECGWRVALTVPTDRIVRRCSRRDGNYDPPGDDSVCPHLGDPVFDADDNPVSVAVPCKTCGHNKGVKPFSVWQCEIFGECLPHYRPTAAQRAEYASREDAIQLCDGCGRR